MMIYQLISVLSNRLYCEIKVWFDRPHLNGSLRIGWCGASVHELPTKFRPHRPGQNSSVAVAAADHGTMPSQIWNSVQGHMRYLCLLRLWHPPKCSQQLPLGHRRIVLWPTAHCLNSSWCMPPSFRCRAHDDLFRYSIWIAFRLLLWVAILMLVTWRYLFWMNHSYGSTGPCHA